MANQQEEQQVQRVDFREFFTIPTKMLYLVGIPSIISNDNRPNQVTPIGRLWYWILCVNLGSGVVGAITFFVMSIIKGSDLIRLTSQSPVVAYSFSGVTEMIIVWRHRTKLSLILSKLKILYETHCKYPDQQKDLKKNCRDSNTQIINFLILYFGMVNLFHLIPIIITTMEYMETGQLSLELPYQTWFPFDVYNKYIFPWMYVNENIWGLVAILIILCENLMLGLLISQVCIQFDILSNKIRTMRKRIPNRSADLRAEFRDLVIQHLKLIELSDEIGDLFALSLVINYFLNSIIICSTGFQIVFNKNYAESIKFFFLLLCILLQTLSLSYHGNHITECVRTESDENIIAMS